MNNVLHNTTFAVDNRLVDAFLDFMRGTYLPALTAAGASDCVLARMATEADMAPCFALQHRRAHCQSVAVDNAISALKAEMAKRWADGVVWFDSVLEIIAESDDGRSC